MESVRLQYVGVALASLLLAGCARFESHPIVPAERAASFEARTLADPGLRQFLEKNLARRWDSWPLKSWNFETLHLAALYYHPSLDVARAQWQAALGGQKTAAARPNPTVSAVPGYDINPPEFVTPWFPAVTFDIPLETAGKRGYRQAQARQLSEASRLNLAATAWQVRSNLRSSLIDFAAAQRREGLLRSQQSVQENVVRLLEGQLRAGAVSRAELTPPRIALGKIQLDLAEAQQQLAEACVRVADAIGVAVAALAGLELAYDVATRPADAPALMAPEVRGQALQNRADLRGALAEYAASQSTLQLEVAKQYPDIHLGPGYQYDQGEHKFSLSVTAELPLLNQNQGPIAEAAAHRTLAAARFDALQAKVIGEIDRALAAYRAARDSLSTLESLAASQKQRAETVAAQFQAGAADRIEWLNVQLELGAGELLQLSGQVKIQQAYGALEDAFQRPLESMPPRLIEASQRPPAKQENKP